MELNELQKQVKLAQSGDRNALEMVCRELQEEVKNTFSRLIENRELIEDLSQETYVRLIKGIRNIKEPIKIRSFVAKIALYVINDYFRKQYKWKNIFFMEQSIEDEVVRKDGDIKEISNEDLFNTIAIEEVIHIIPDKIDKKLIMLRLEGKNYKEISHELEISEGAAKMRYRRTLEFLKTQYKD